jgi:thiol-disulfide isomerase/thioredoxin
MRTLTLVALATLVLSNSAANPPDKSLTPKTKPAEPKLDTSFALKDVQLGKPVSGPHPAATDLTGKVVVVEFWGVSCPRCLAALPETAALHADLADFGLVVIGAHVQNAPAEQVKAVAKARGVNFAVTERASVPSDDIPELPHAIVFDADGKCVFRGTPRDAEVKARVAVGEWLVANTGRERFSAEFAPVVSGLRKGQSPHLALPKVLALLDSPQPAADDAKALLASLTAVGRAKLKQAKAVAETDPAEALRLAESLPRTFKGVPLAAEATELLTRLKR